MATKEPTGMALAAAEREDLADFLAGLTPEQWRAPSLCAGWSVRDVVAHVISYDEIGWRGLPWRLLRGRLGGGDANAVGLRDYAQHSPEDLLALLRTHLTPRGLPAAFGGMIGLTDALIHHQDIRRPLGLPRTVPPERLAAALPRALAAPVLPAKQNAAGLRLVVTDLDLVHGDGPEVRGPGEALLLAVAGREAALTDLDGPGLATLTTRVSQGH